MNSSMIFLIGFMGSGKSTLGKKLAKKFGLNFVDLDELIVEKRGASIPTLFEKIGESGFRELEKEVLLTLNQNNTTIVSVGGGTPCYGNNMEWMNTHGTTIYLKLSPKVIFSRLKQSNLSDRPLISGLNEEELLKFIEDALAKREVYYEKASYSINPIKENMDDLISSLINQNN
jgi:shikimate kinase